MLTSFTSNHGFCPVSRKLNEETYGIIPVFLYMWLPCTFTMKYMDCSFVGSSKSTNLCNQRGWSLCSSSEETLGQDSRAPIKKNIRIM